MNTSYTTYPKKPTLVNVIAWTTLASGIVNIGWGLAITFGALISIIGICCTPLTILPAILGIFEIIYAAKLLSTPPQAVRPATNLAILEIVCVLTGNFFTVVVGILSLIFYNDATVKEYFARLNADVAPGSVPPAAPQITPLVTPAPVEEPIPSPISGEEPVASVVEPQEEEPTPMVEEIPLSEPPVSPEPPSATDETIVSSFHREEPPANELPAAPEEPNPPDKPTEE